MPRRHARMLLILFVGMLSNSCRQDMHDQPRKDPFERSRMFMDGRSARPQVEGTVAVGQLPSDGAFTTGRVNGELVSTIPVPVTLELLERGRERFGIFCTACHDGAGRGRGVVVERGFRRPPSFHEDRLRAAPVGHFFDVITNGFGAMYDFSDRVPPADRWAIAAYIRALQLSQHASVDDVPEGERAALSGTDR